MKYKFLYVDDEKEERLRHFILPFDKTNIAITIQSPDDFEEQLKKMLTKEYDGFILDWRLDQECGEDGKPKQYTAAGLAQEIRTKTTEKLKFEKPIILWSTLDRLRTSYGRDDTSHDLFDMTYDKDDIPSIYKQISKELEALVEGYQEIIKKRTKSKGKMSYLLGLNKENAYILDSRLEDMFNVEETRPAHEFAQFILRELVLTPGPLIDEQYLAARLGIDIKKSDDWDKLREKYFNDFKYTGPFNKAWERWWSIQLENWWDSLEAGIVPLQLIDATERVDILKQKTKIKKLSPAKVIKGTKGYSNKFWTVCIIRKEPVDLSDCFMIDSKRNYYPWQERRYISKISAINREHKDPKHKYNIHIRDRKNLEYLLSED